MQKPEPQMTFSFQSIDILENSLKHQPARELNTEGFLFNIQIDHQLDSENSLISVVVTVRVCVEQSDNVLASLTTLCVFKIENLEDILEAVPGSSELPENSAVLLNSIAISTTRGIAFAIFRGTYLHRVIIPVIDPKGFKIKPDSGGS